MELVKKSDILPYNSYRDFGEALFTSGSSLSVLTADKIINNDLKQYQNGNIKFGLAQIEVGNLVDFGSRLSDISKGPRDVK